MTSTDLGSLISSPILESLLLASKTAQENAQQILSTQSAPASSHSTLLAQLAHLRTQHRKTTLALRTTKAETAYARTEVDSLHLTLQNLRYEQTHLRAEIEACERYEHAYTELPLESEEVFLAARPELQDVGAHELTLACIEHERVQRETLERERLALLKKKQALVKENLKRKEDLQGLDGRMEAFIDAARPIEKVLGLGTSAEKVDGVEDASGKDNAAAG